MKDLNYHYNYEDTSEVIFQFPTGYNFGDKISVLNMHRSFDELYNLNARLSVKGVHDSDDLYLSHLFFENRLSSGSATCLNRITYTEIGTDEIFTEIYKNRYVTFNRHSDIDDKLITYSFDCNTYVDMKIPNYIGELISDLMMRRPDLKFVEIGKNLGLRRSLELILISKLSMNVDNGISHLCRCTQTPQLLIEHKKSMNRGHPTAYYDNFQVCRSKEDIVRSIESV